MKTEMSLGLLMSGLMIGAVSAEEVANPVKPVVAKETAEAVATTKPDLAPAKPAPEAASTAATVPKTSAGSSASIGETIDLKPEQVLRKATPPGDTVIEGRHATYSGVVPAVSKGGFKGFVNLFNPFGKMTEAEWQAQASSRNRPLPRAFVDDTRMSSSGITLISVDPK